jgi:hypothetical protein
VAARRLASVPFLSSVDNGWLATALVMVENGVPELREKAHALVAAMDFGFYYDPAVGQLRGGAWTEKPPGDSDPAGDVWFTKNHYDVLNSEPRMASYLGIAAGQVPPEHYSTSTAPSRPLCVGRLPGVQPSGETRTYLGVDVYEGHYDYRGMHIVPTWGGDMFEALMVPLFVPEERWGPRSWGVNHPLYVRAQIEHGLDEAGYGYWGFSPSDNPSGGYSAYGVDAIGEWAVAEAGVISQQPDLVLRCGLPRHAGLRIPTCRPAYSNGSSRHASFLALAATRAALANLARLRSTSASARAASTTPSTSARARSRTPISRAREMTRVSRCTTCCAGSSRFSMRSSTATSWCGSIASTFPAG